MMARNLDPLMKASVHGKDEKIDIESLRLRTDFLVSLARNYLGA
jgi:di/tripeptidase